MNTDHVSPVAEHVINKCGGIEKMAEILGRGTLQIRRFMYPTSKQGGTGGKIPLKHWEPILSWAQKNGIEMDELDFIEAPTGKAKPLEVQAAE